MWLRNEALMIDRGRPPCLMFSVGAICDYYLLRDRFKISQPRHDTALAARPPVNLCLALWIRDASFCLLFLDNVRERRELQGEDEARQDHREGGVRQLPRREVSETQKDVRRCRREKIR